MTPWSQQAQLLWLARLEDDVDESIGSELWLMPVHMTMCDDIAADAIRWRRDD